MERNVVSGIKFAETRRIPQVMHIIQIRMRNLGMQNDLWRRASSAYIYILDIEKVMVILQLLPFCRRRRATAKDEAHIVTQKV